MPRPRRARKVAHTIALMGPRFVRCSCGWVGNITPLEYARLSTLKSEDLLLDLHAAHVLEKGLSE